MGDIIRTKREGRGKFAYTPLMVPPVVTSPVVETCEPEPSLPIEEQVTAQDELEDEDGDVDEVEEDEVEEDADEEEEEDEGDSPPEEEDAVEEEEEVEEEKAEGGELFADLGEEAVPEVMNEDEEIDTEDNTEEDTTVVITEPGWDLLKYWKQK